MKKIFIILALVAMVMMPIVARGTFSVGLEVGQPSGVTFGYQPDDRSDFYITGAFRFGKVTCIDAIIGYQKVVTNFKISNAAFDFLMGIQVGSQIYFGETAGTTLSVKITTAVDYDWTWENVGDFTAYIRTGLGTRCRLSGEAKAGFTWLTTLGCVYHF